jgi:hypothetical protein
MPITNYLKIEKDIMSVEHNKIQKDSLVEINQNVTSPFTTTCDL